MRTTAAAGAVLLVLTACGSPPPHGPHDADERRPSSLSDGDIATAVAIAHDVIADQGATVTSATVISRLGTLRQSNTGHPCTSGRELRIKLIGDFPHTVTTGHPVDPGEQVADFTVRAVLITADPATGLACLIGVQTAENGEPRPAPGATTLSLD
jgi:hypothetical protein